ncbi:MAG: DUF3883 domain-containing protein [Planctomycetia bacterium]|nr:DUF3883 domain-containing protein [Planctomycetia bacterium]
MAIHSSEKLTPGQIYSRNELMQLFAISDATIRTGTFRPDGHDSVWLFMTEEKSSDRTPYVDRLDGDNLYFEGQTKGRTDLWLVRHRELGLELLVFYRKSKKEYSDYAFRYEGPFEYVSSEDGPPTKFHLRRVRNREADVVSLQTVHRVGQVRENIRRFHRDVANNFARAQSLAQQTTYWVYDAESDLFGPGKFVGYQGMNFTRYNSAVDGRSTGASFDGAVTRAAIEATLGAFAANPELAEELDAWMVATFGAATVAGINRGKWRFIALDTVVHYWAFVCNPDKYDVTSALAVLDELCWTLDRGDPKTGDRIIIWQAKGSSENRGVVALGEVIADPSVMPEPESERQFWQVPPPADPARRTRFRILQMPNLPLWEADYPEELSGLAAARARGGTGFTLEPQQWRTIVTLAGNEDRRAVPQQKHIASGQGYGLSPAERKTVERYAQQLAEDYFIQKGFDVDDVSSTSPYDLHCCREAEELRVEVKGTTGDGGSVFLTRNEVEHARRHRGRIAIFLVRNIVLDRTAPQPVARAGNHVIYWPWDIDQGVLTPLQFEYQLPGDHSST